MINDTLVSINVINQRTNTLLNESQVPLLFYYNGEGDLKHSIVFNKSFIEKYISKIKSYEDYKNILVCYFDFEFDEKTGDEVYHDEGFYLHEYFHFSDLPINTIAGDLVEDKMKQLYKTSTNNEYIYNGRESFGGPIHDIFIKLKSLYGERVQKETLINYIRSEIIKDGFDSVNTHYCINILEKNL